MNRKRLDIGVPLVFAVAIVLTSLFGAEGTTVGMVALVGAIAIGFYFAMLRKNIEP
ncbi:hypothetical protein ACWDR1_21560 [Streptosporangium sandarakinum]|uniref:hypothetical protein n=1 Tax=Streptosporangium sandarakinum TaxID=1260955 RepID=UPI00339F00D0